MGREYDGPYVKEIGHHEGYATAVINGVEPLHSWIHHEGEDGYLLAACDHGDDGQWRGTTRYPMTDAGEDQALAEWEQEHLHPLIAKAESRWPQWAQLVARLGKDAADQIAAGRYAAAEKTLQLLAGEASARLRMARELAEQAQHRADEPRL